VPNKVGMSDTPEGHRQPAHALPPSHRQAQPSMHAGTHRPQNNTLPKTAQATRLTKQMQHEVSSTYKLELFTAVAVAFVPKVAVEFLRDNVLPHRCRAIPIILEPRSISPAIRP
jgi:hypothetical protein